MNKTHFLIALSDVSQDGTTLSITDMSGTVSWCVLHHFCPERGKCNESSAPLAGRCPASVGTVAFRARCFTRCLLPAGVGATPQTHCLPGESRGERDVQ